MISIFFHHSILGHVFPRTKAITRQHHQADTSLKQSEKNYSDTQHCCTLAVILIKLFNPRLLKRTFSQCPNYNFIYTWKLQLFHTVKKCLPLGLTPSLEEIYVISFSNSAGRKITDFFEMGKRGWAADRPLGYFITTIRWFNRVRIRWISLPQYHLWPYPPSVQTDERGRRHWTSCRRFCFRFLSHTFEGESGGGGDYYGRRRRRRAGRGGT